MAESGFGNVGHLIYLECSTSWLMADVDLYPPGWNERRAVVDGCFVQKLRASRGVRFALCTLRFST